MGLGRDIGGALGGFLGGLLPFQNGGQVPMQFLRPTRYVTLMKKGGMVKRKRKAKAKARKGK